LLLPVCNSWKNINNKLPEVNQKQTLAVQRLQQPALINTFTLPSEHSACPAPKADHLQFSHGQGRKKMAPN